MSNIGKDTVPISTEANIISNVTSQTVSALLSTFSVTQPPSSSASQSSVTTISSATVTAAPPQNKSNASTTPPRTTPAVSSTLPTRVNENTTNNNSNSQTPEPVTAKAKKNSGKVESPSVQTATGVVKVGFRRNNKQKAESSVSSPQPTPTPPTAVVNTNSANAPPLSVAASSSTPKKSKGVSSSTSSLVAASSTAQNEASSATAPTTLTSSFTEAKLSLPSTAASSSLSASGPITNSSTAAILLKAPPINNSISNPATPTTHTSEPSVLPTNLVSLSSPPPSSSSIRKAVLSSSSPATQQSKPSLTLTSIYEMNMSDSQGENIDTPKMQPPNSALISSSTLRRPKLSSSISTSSMSVESSSLPAQTDPPIQTVDSSASTSVLLARAPLQQSASSSSLQSSLDSSKTVVDPAVVAVRPSLKFPSSPSAPTSTLRGSATESSVSLSGLAVKIGSPSNPTTSPAPFPAPFPSPFSSSSSSSSSSFTGSSQSCSATKEELLAADGSLTVLTLCPLCSQKNNPCPVGDHLSSSIRGELRHVRMAEVLYNCRSEKPLEDVLSEPLPFKIPVFDPDTVRLCPNVFELGKAEYGPAVDAWLSHSIVSPTADVCVKAMDFVWLNAIKDACNANIYINGKENKSNSVLPDIVVSLGKALAMIVESRAAEFELEDAATELCIKLHSKAYKSFPKGRDTLVGVTSCATVLRMHGISFDPYTRRYSQRILRSYRVDCSDGRRDFIVDVFKVIRWMAAIHYSEENFHLIPGARRQTASGHCVSWIRTGLFKEFKHDSIRFDIIRQVYNANLRFVERGFADGRSIVISSVGKTLNNAISERLIANKKSVIDQVREAMDSLHYMGVAHCDICCDNIFVMDDGAIILGDLQHCTEIQMRPGKVKRMYGNPDTALELDENQYVRFIEELSSYF